MHNAARGQFKAWNYGMMIPSMLMSSATSIGTIRIRSQSASSSEESQNSNQINWVLIGIGTAGVMALDLAFIDDQNDAEHHRNNKMFTSQHEFIKFVKSRMDVLVDKAPPIPKKIARRYEAKMSTDRRLGVVEVRLS
eukprot:gene19604-26287_t